MGIVTQEIILFNDTIYNNVAYGRSDIGEEAVHRVLQAACADDFVGEMPEGIHTMIGDRGVKLSGGQIGRSEAKDSHRPGAVKRSSHTDF
jgi:subfamily B ATP-binding cassette protein MsbA